MSSFLLQLLLFTSKAFIVLSVILIVMVVFFVLLAKNKQKTTGQLSIKNINHIYDENKDLIFAETMTKKEFKAYQKQQKQLLKEREENKAAIKNIFVLNFNGDIKASAVASLSREITAVLTAAKPNDEVVVRIESPGGMVPGYGLGAAQLLRLREHKIRLTVTIDKMAASGGYLMACTADKILAAPFAIVGSIGVVIQLPNFHRVLKSNHIDYEMQTAGEYKRTITMFGENTEAGREKLQEEIDKVHDQFKALIKQNRPHVDLAKTATGEHWLAQEALALQLVDEIKTSDEYLLSQAAHANLFEVNFAEKKSFIAKLTSSAQAGLEKLRMLGLLA